MTKKQIIKMFEEKNVRTVWDDKEEKWYFSIVDVVGVLFRLIQSIPSPKAEPFKQWMAQVAKGKASDYLPPVQDADARELPEK